MNPTLYDILGVSTDASRDEIRKAWREAADRFEPGEGGSTKQFRLFNEAAEVLLDPERRKEYDDRLADPGGQATTKAGGSGAAADQGAAAASVPTGTMPGAAQATTSVVEPVKSRWAARRERRREQEPQVGEPTGPAPGGSGPDLSGDPVARARRTIPWPVLAVLGVVTAVAVGLAAFFVVRAERAEAYQEAVDRAPAAAENAAAAVLSYNYKSLEADRDAAAKFLTGSYRKQYVDTFDKLVEKGATQTKATVKADVLASSAMVVGEKRDPDRVPVLLFVNQTTTSSASSEPAVALNRVRFDMVRSDGTWLVDGITSY